MGASVIWTLCRCCVKTLGMTGTDPKTPKRKTPGDRDGTAADARAARLKAALRANLARRKAQARARSQGADPAGSDHPAAVQERPNDE